MSVEYSSESVNWLVWW